ncbi:hypothetical protein BC351_01210 [Paenibacillus ferrarius]|uniref:Uncharacterized protein n=1 Tax=Paenibacillus ferrarius TaxID=1469647 RepID=A0A1V4HSG6_9BACL|nr:hypothetical protein [Paenibacillus ferrarius]OPH61889.1 hypothetical protein BC351_01210 [Paenibacillus ferrarius]
MAYKYDEENHTYYKLEMCSAEDVAENGEQAKFVRGEYDRLPSPDIIADQARRLGFDTFEVTTVTENVKRYSVDSL